MANSMLILYIVEDMFDIMDTILNILNSIMGQSAQKKRLLLLTRIRNEFLGVRSINFKDNKWLDIYNEHIFYRLFRMTKTSFGILVDTLLHYDQYSLLRKKYRGGNYPVQPEQSVLIFLWFMAHEDPLFTIGLTFHVAASTVLQIVNVVLYIICGLKSKYIFWPKTLQEFNSIQRGFTHYPGTVGSMDGCHIDVKVPSNQQDSYINRYLGHSINLLGICTADRIFTYTFIGFPGSAHDSRVFSNSLFVRNIAIHGKEYYFPSPDLHIIADAAFPIKSWLLKPYRQSQGMGRMKKHHNTNLSKDRVVIENVWALVKGRWRRTIRINTNTVSKAIEITTAACILHNFCYKNNDPWEGDLYEVARQIDGVLEGGNDIQEARLGEAKRNMIARAMF